MHFVKLNNTTLHYQWQNNQKETNFVLITDKGQELINVIEQLGVQELTSPLTTALFETRFNDVSSGKTPPDVVKAEITKFVTDKTLAINSGSIKLTTDFSSKINFQWEAEQKRHVDGLYLLSVHVEKPTILIVLSNLL